MNISRLKRAVYPMADYVAQALKKSNLTEEYKLPPSYQQNDYMGWITRGNKEETRRKHLRQMLDELQAGNSYMGMQYNTRKRGK